MLATVLLTSPQKWLPISHSDTLIILMYSLLLLIRQVNLPAFSTVFINVL